MKKLFSILISFQYTKDTNKHFICIEYEYK